MTDDPEIRDLLGRALEGEPPLRLDRDEVFRQGRKRVRRRRRLEAGAVVASVVAVAVAAVTFTGLLNRDPKGVPAGDGGPTPTELAPDILATAPGVAEPSDPPTDVSEQRTKDMTVALEQFLPTGLVLTPMVNDVSGFRMVDGVYQLTAELIGEDGQGSLYIGVAPSKPDDRTDCVVFADQFSECELLGTDQDVVAVAAESFSGGERHYAAFAGRSDGTTVTATVTNVSETQLANGESPTTPDPVLSRQELADLAQLRGLSYY